MNKIKKLAVLVSGSGTNLQAIIDAVQSGDLKDTEIAIVISNKKDAYALKRAEKAHIKNLFLNPKDFKSNPEYDKKMMEIIASNRVDLIVLAGYLKILSDTFVKTFQGKIINIHPALLPDFGGMYGEKVHNAVLESKVKESGCTVHFVDTGIDTGPVVAQRKVPVLENDTVETLSKRILEQEHKLIVEAIKKILFETTLLRH